ncbi:MAG: ATPase, T2SS/T4P/T4SS family, partial [Limisphaera sp.]
GASDIEIIEGQPPVFRIHRTMQPQDLPVLERSDLESILSPDQLEQLTRNLDIDVSYSVPGVSRFRVNIYHDRGGLVAVFRTIPQNIPDLRKLGLPDVLLNLTEARSGLILVTGPTGSGKSTTLAALIKHINQTRAVKIITIEDPVEYLHTPIKARISQRQVGVDVKDFERGL